MNKKIKVITLCILSLSIIEAGFTLFPKQEQKAKQEPKVKQEPKEKQEKEYISTKEEMFEDRRKKEEEEILRIKQESLENYLERMKPENREKYINTLKRITEVKEKRKFNKKVYTTFIERKEKFITLNIPFQQIIHINFDKKIIKLESASNKYIKLEINTETAKELIIENKDLTLNHNIKLSFLDGTTKNLVLKYGDSPSKRYVVFNLFMGKTKMNILPEFKKKLSIRNIHSYFNHVSTKLLLDKLLKKESFITIEENKKIVNKTLFEGEVKKESFYGEGVLNYKLTLNTVFETPYIKDVKGSNIKKKRLVMLELTVKNKDFSTLILTPEFVKKRFANYTAIYLGDLKSKENEVQPGQSKKILVVIEDEYQDSNN
jgi:hypothetical protein